MNGKKRLALKTSSGTRERTPTCHGRTNRISERRETARLQGVRPVGGLGGEGMPAQWSRPSLAASRMLSYILVSLKPSTKTPAGIGIGQRQHEKTRPARPAAKLLSGRR